MKRSPTVANGGNTTYYIYDGEKPIIEYGSVGGIVGRNVYGKGIDEILMRSDPGSNRKEKCIPNPTERHFAGYADIRPPLHFVLQLRSRRPKAAGRELRDAFFSLSASVEIQT